MSDAASDLVMTRAEFFAWVPPDDRRYEFDGFRPVAMTGGSINHNRISQNLWAALRARLRGTGCEALGPDAGLATIGAAVRYPDALVTCARVRGDQRLVPGVVVVFEVLSPGNSGFTDRITKMREYWAVPTIQRYVILETGGRALQMMARAPGATFWEATALVAEDILPLPEIGIELTVAELYEGIELPKDGRWPPGSEDEHY